jgi:hypothetical protein
MAGSAKPEAIDNGEDPTEPTHPDLPAVLFVSHAGEAAGAELCLLDVATASSASSIVLLLSDGPFRPLLEKAGVRVS